MVQNVEMKVLKEFATSQSSTSRLPYFKF